MTRFAFGLSEKRGIPQEFPGTADFGSPASSGGRALLLHWRLGVFLWLLTGVLATAGPLSVRVPKQGFREDRVLVRWKPGTDPSQLESFHLRRQSRVLRHYKNLGELQALQVPQGRSAAEFIQDLQASGLVEVAEPDFWVTPTGVTAVATPSNDPAFKDGLLWYLNNQGEQGGVAGADIHALEGWSTLHDATNVIVALIDTGIWLTHEDLAPNLWTNPGEIPNNGLDDDNDGIVDDVHGLNAAANNGNPIDLNGHGSTVAGVVGAVGDNGLGTAGVAWHVQLLPCRFTDDAGEGSLSDVVQCFDYARSKGAKVINASFVSTNFSSVLLTAVTSCRNAGIIVVAGAGNDSSDNDAIPVYPAGYDLDTVISVGASSRFDTPSSYANYGKASVDLFAPGDEIYTTAAVGNSLYFTGTGSSYSTAMVSGACALLRARFPTLSATQIVQRLLSTVDPLPAFAGKCVTGGRLNLAAALGPSVVASFTTSSTHGGVPFTVHFTNSSYGSIVEWAWDFGDGTSSSETNPIHTYTANGVYSAKLTVTAANTRTSTTNQTVFVLGPYRVESTVFEWVDTTNMTTLTLTGDGVSAAQSIPFGFEFYGEIYTSLFVGANGLAGFSATRLNIAQNTDLPLPSNPNGLLAPYWDDLAPGKETLIRFGIHGTEPNRVAVVSWESIHTVGARPTTVSFQLLLEETSNRIRFQYLDVAQTSSSPSAAGKSATVGVEDPTGILGTRFSFNGSSPLTNHQALVFSPAPISRVPASPTLSVLVSSSGTTVSLELRGDPNTTYSLEGTIDLQTWTPVTSTLTDASGVARLDLDPTAGAPWRFFRATWKP